MRAEVSCLQHSPVGPSSTFQSFLHAVGLHESPGNLPISLGTNISDPFSLGLSVCRPWPCKIQNVKIQRLQLKFRHVFISLCLGNIRQSSAICRGEGPGSDCPLLSVSSRWPVLPCKTRIYFHPFSSTRAKAKCYTSTWISCAFGEP